VEICGYTREVCGNNRNFQTVFILAVRVLEILDLGGGIETGEKT